MRVAPGFSVGQFIIIAVYFACVAYASFYHSNIFTDKRRTGWVATSQMPIVFLFAQKNNVIGSVLGYGYEKVRNSALILNESNDDSDNFQTVEFRA